MTRMSRKPYIRRFGNLDDLVDLVDPSSGRLWGNIDPGRYCTPSLRGIDGERLIPDWSKQVQYRTRDVHLERFLRLGAGSEPAGERIREYANEHGLLELCSHNVPRFHDPRCFEAPTVGEPIKSWWSCARRFQAILHIRAAHFRNQLGGQQDWITLIGKELDHQLPRKPKSLALAKLFPPMVVEKAVLMNSINELIRMSGTQPMLSLDLQDRSASIKLYCPCLFAVLVMKTAAACVGNNIAICANPECGYQFSKNGREEYCSDCRARGVPNLLRQRRFRNRHGKHGRRMTFEKATQTRKS